MRESDRLNAILERHAPAMARCLSPLGRRSAFPKGIPFQASQAKGTEINGTIGQLTDAAGQPIPLPELAAGVEGLDPRALFLYAPVAGPTSLRDAWGARERRIGHASDAVRTTSPIVTHGLTHGLSILADMFSDEDTDVIVPEPFWGNYGLIFRMHRDARIVSYPFFRDGRFNVEGLADALAKVRHKAIVILNLPGNPTGYAVRNDEVPGIVEVVTNAPKPTVVAVDDAYQGWVYESGHLDTSIFWPIAEAADPEKVVPVKIDGATKELAFFASRVGFATTVVDAEAEEAWQSKVMCLIRGTVGSASGPALAMVDKALHSPTLDASFAARRDLMRDRYLALKGALDDLGDDRVKPEPFNAAYFALLKLDRTIDPEALRVKLLNEHSVGTIAFADAGALRIAYCSLGAEQLPELVSRLGKALR